MELMSGLEMVTHVLRLAPQTVIIYDQRPANDPIPIEAMRAGAFDYIPKPFDLHHVEKAVRRALGHHNYSKAKDCTRTTERVWYNSTPRKSNAWRITTGHRSTNRVLFEDRLARALAVARNKGQMLGMLFFAFDRFKENQ